MTLNSHIYLYYFCKIEKNILGRSCLAALLTQTWEVFPQGWGVKCIVQGLYILQTGMHAWHLEHIVAPWQEIQSLTAHTNPLYYSIGHFEWRHVLSNFFYQLQIHW